METLLKWEEALMFAFAFFLFLALDMAWWWFFVFLLAPDLSMVGYLFGPRVGAFAYNLAHHKGVAVAVYLLGGYLNNPVLQFVGLILFGHSSMDRALGYGLKYPDSFQHTHLGMIGNRA